MSIIIRENKNEVRLYLLGQLREEDEERMELRLLTDPAFGEDFDAVVNEITDQYAANELQDEDRRRVEQYFLRSAERQDKVRIACELRRQAAVERGGKVVNAPVPPEPSWWEGVSLFWNRQPLSLRFATIFATLVILVGIGMLVLPARNATAPSYTALALNISNSDRSVGSQTQSVKPQPGDAGVRLDLNVPDGTAPAQSYRVNLQGEQVSRDLPVAEQNDGVVVVIIPTGEVPPGSYTLQLFGVNADGTEQRIRGSYFFNLE